MGNKKIENKVRMAHNQKLFKVMFVVTMIFILMILSLSTFAQPAPQDNCTPACYTNNPPWWCDCKGNPVPLDDYIGVLILLGAVGGGYYIYKNKKLETN
jgi:hypothetical protein